MVGLLLLVIALGAASCAALLHALPTV